MEAKIKHIGMKKMVQTSLVKCVTVIFCDLFRVYKWIDSAVEKFLSMLPPLTARNQDPSYKIAFSKFYSPKNEIDVSFTSSNVQKMTQITETKNTNKEKSCFFVVKISITLLRKVNFKKWCLQGRIMCSEWTCPLVYVLLSFFLWTLTQNN